ncbi:sugar ABC transporter substrate-binding protein [Streptomyces capparidis]
MRRWTPRALACLLAGLLAAASLTNCAPGDGGGRTVVTYWSWISGSQELADRFNATHDDIEVRFEKVPAGTAGGYAKMFNAVRAGKAPDVVTVEYPQLPGFVTQQVVQPLTRWGVDELAGQYPDWAWRQTHLGGRTYALPLNIAPMLLYYRKDLFARYGLTPPATWEEFADTARRLRERDPRARLTNFSSNDPALLAGLCWQAGAHWFSTEGGRWTVDTGDPATRRVTRYWQSLVDDGAVTAEAAFTEKHVTDLQRGRSLTLLGAPWMIANVERFAPDLEGTWGVAPLPRWPGRTAVANLGGSALAVPSGAGRPEAAMQFIRWASTSPEAVRALAPVSAAFPANANLVEPANRARAEANSYLDADALFATAARAAEEVDGSWEWGPDMTAGFVTLQDGMTSALGGRGGFDRALDRWRSSTVEHLRQRGYQVGDGERARTPGG